MSELRGVLSSEAQRDLDALRRYVSSESGMIRAELVLGRLQRAIGTLAFMPGLGRPKPYLNPGLLAFPVPPWLIVYQLLPEMDGIVVVRVVDARRDLSTLFGEP